MKKYVSAVVAALMFLTPFAIASDIQETNVFELNKEVDGVVIEAKAVDGVDKDTCVAKIEDSMGNRFEFVIEAGMTPEDNKFEAKVEGDVESLSYAPFEALDFCLGHIITVSM